MPDAYAQKSSDVNKTPLAHIKEYSRKQNRFVIAELSEETQKALTAPVSEEAAKVWNQSDMQKFLSKSPQELPHVVVFKNQDNLHTPTFSINQGFKNDLEKLREVRDLLTSFTPDQWKGLEASGYNYPTRLLTATQKQLLNKFAADFVTVPESLDATYELDFRTWMTVRGADNTPTVRLLGGTVTPQ